METGSTNIREQFQNMIWVENRDGVEVGVNIDFKYAILVLDACVFAPWKFNSSPLKSYQNPIGKDHLPFP